MKFTVKLREIERETKHLFITFSFQVMFSILTIYMRKLLDSDWRRAVQFKHNTVQKVQYQCNYTSKF